MYTQVRIHEVSDFIRVPCADVCMCSTCTSTNITFSKDNSCARDHQFLTLLFYCRSSWGLSARFLVVRSMAAPSSSYSSWCYAVIWHRSFSSVVYREFWVGLCAAFWHDFWIWFRVAFGARDLCSTWSISLRPRAHWIFFECRVVSVLRTLRFVSRPIDFLTFL